MRGRSFILFLEKHLFLPSKTMKRFFSFFWAITKILQKIAHLAEAYYPKLPKKKNGGKIAFIVFFLFYGRLGSPVGLLSIPSALK